MLTLPSPAKLNLFLHIVGRRKDGYHLLQSVMQFLDFSDTLTFKTHDDDSIILSTDHPALQGPDNLILKAAYALRAIGKMRRGARITLKKRIPLGAGLGGGSSNAATTLLALNTLWKLHLPSHELLKIGSTLGADVPFFVKGTTAWVEGIGECLYPLDIPEPWFVICVPRVHIQTKDIYHHPQLTRNTEVLTIRKFHPSMGQNDCEPLVCQLNSEVRDALQHLSRYAPARMTGTGSAVFASFPIQKEAKQVARALKGMIYSIFVAKGLNRSPVLPLTTSYWAVAKR
ncbi:MAG: 4-(cytidine 5'-diphospho)-2-C-methyl-D-erythritol kinase [Gammaproteobacteria bacterium]|nr:4-(cytidine 5'-diphospho)-2-C-methyl-D-erythritol kinase [Gammaproteobacteria bacterium]